MKSPVKDTSVSYDYVLGLRIQAQYCRSVGGQIFGATVGFTCEQKQQQLPFLSSLNLRLLGCSIGLNMSLFTKLGQNVTEGTSWDERGNSGIMQILISHQEALINSIQFVYVTRQDKVERTKVYGEPNGLKFDVVTLNYPSEFLTSVGGEFDDNGLASISFTTNKRKFGPFGGIDRPLPDPIFKKFNYNFGHRECFLGFHGSVKDSRLYAIGIYVYPATTHIDFKTAK